MFVLFQVKVRKDVSFEEDGPIKNEQQTKPYKEDVAQTNGQSKPSSAASTSLCNIL